MPYTTMLTVADDTWIEQANKEIQQHAKDEVIKQQRQQQQQKRKLKEPKSKGKRQMSRRTARYYYQWGETATLPWTEPREGWQVFDRDSTSKTGENFAICLCLTRSHAVSIVRGLNTQARVVNKSDGKLKQ